MTGKAAASYKDKQYRNYWCSRATRSRALCGHYNGHSTTKLESAVLEYLGQFSDPGTVRGHIEAADRDELSRKRSELKDIEVSLENLETQFTQNLGFLRRGVLNEQEFVKANNMARDQQSAFQESKETLAQWIEEQTGREETIERVPGMIKTFLEAFQHMESRVQKTHLHTILETAIQGLDEIDAADYQPSATRFC